MNAFVNYLAINVEASCFFHRARSPLQRYASVCTRFPAWVLVFRSGYHFSV